MPRQLFTIVVIGTLMLISSYGCTQCSSEDKSQNSKQTLSFAQGKSFVLEVADTELEKIVGGPTARRQLKHFFNNHQLILISQSSEKHVFTLGLSSQATSYGEASYVRVRGRADNAYIHLPAFQVKLVKGDGTVCVLDVSGMRIKPKASDSSIISGVFKANAQGGMMIQTGEHRISADFFGVWGGRLDKEPPEVTIVPPAKGLLSGNFNVFFNEPVHAINVPKRIFLRDENNNVLKTRIQIVPTDIKDYATHLRIETQDLLPFNQQLSLAVGVGFSDIAGHKLTRPVVEVIRTPGLPPRLSGSGTDFSVGQEQSIHKQGDVEFINTYRDKLKPYTGRFLKITPPKPGSRYSSAITTRLKVPAKAQTLQVRVLKSALSQEINTPCLRYVVAHVDGVLWNVECGPTDVPKTMLVANDEEFFTTPWIHLNIDVEGQRGQELLLILEAKPLAPKMGTTAQPEFLVDLIRTVDEGQDANSYEQPTPPKSLETYQ